MAAAGGGAGPAAAAGPDCPLPCLVAIAVCALTAEGHERAWTRSGSGRQASQADLAWLRVPPDPWTGLRPAPDKSMVRRLLGPHRAAGGSTAGATALAQPMASAHLRCLLDCRMLRVRPRGRASVLPLTTRPELLAVLTVVRTCPR